MRLSSRWSFVLVGLSLAASSISAAQSLDIVGTYGNADGCKYAKDGILEDDELLVLKPDELQSYGTGCEFVEVLTGKDGSKVVTGLCGYEGEDGLGTQSFVVAKSKKDPAGLVIYNSDGSVFGEVAPCP